MVGVIFAYIHTVYWFYDYSFLCLTGCFSIIIWTPNVLSVLYACVLYFCICTCSEQLSMFHMERRSRNTLIIIIISIIIIITTIYLCLIVHHPWALQELCSCMNRHNQTGITSMNISHCLKDNLKELWGPSLTGQS